MNWGSWDNFWAMGGYAFYVWGSYGVTLALIAAEVWLLKRRSHAARRALAERVAAAGAGR